VCHSEGEQFPVFIKNGPPPKGHPANLTQLRELREAFGVNMGQHPCGTPLIPLGVEVLDGRKLGHSDVLGPYALPSVVPFGRRLSSCHTSQ
jgi:hypothetical protein